MITVQFLREHTDIIQIKNLAEITGEPVNTLRGRIYGTAKGFEPKESRHIAEVLRDRGLYEREKISGKEINQKPIIFKRAPLVRQAGLENNNTLLKLYRDKELTQDEQRKLAKVISEIARDMKRTFLSVHGCADN